MLYALNLTNVTDRQYWTSSLGNRQLYPGQPFNVHMKVSPTPNPNFLRVDAQVFEGASPVLRVSTVLGRY